jgi:acyl-CoA synthetase (AMP-forming)/AMP-acid ligase II
MPSYLHALADVRYFRTGDLGRIIDGKFLKITGRHKELYKLENGKYVVPVPVEDAVGRSQFVAQVMVCGANKPHNVALIVPDFAQVNHSFILIHFILCVLCVVSLCMCFCLFVGVAEVCLYSTALCNELVYLFIYTRLQ